MFLTFTSLGRGFAAAVLVTLALAGCSSSGSSPATTSVATSGAGSAAPVTSAAASTQPLVSGALDVCSIVTPADLTSIMSKPATSRPEDGLAGTSSGCMYVITPDDGEEALSIEVVTGDQAAAFFSGNAASPGEDTIPVPGIGTQAMRAPGGPDLVSIKGSVFCEIEAGSGNSDHYVGLASPDPHDNIPDDSASAFAVKIGALCNKIFAAAGS